MGESDIHAVMASGLAGGIGLCGGACGALGAAIWILGMKIGKEEIFLCCKGCASGKAKAEHWTTIHSNFAKAQGICPVMKNKLSKQAKWTIVEGHIVYVCCPPCIKKIEAAPKTYLKKVDELYLASLKQRKQPR